MIRQCMNNKYLYLCYITLLLAGLLSTGHGFFFGANSCDRDENSKYQSLYCWLSKEWRIHIPDVSIKEFIFTMVRNLSLNPSIATWLTEFDSLTRVLVVTDNNIIGSFGGCCSL